MLKLRLLTGPRAGRQLRVSDTKPVSVGRRKGRLRLHDSRVSKQHAEIYFSAGAWVLRDMGSVNGTFVNREKVDGLVELEPGDLVQMGRVLIKIVRADSIGMDTPPGMADDLIFGDLDAPAEAEPVAEAPPAPAASPTLDAGGIDDDIDLDALFAEGEEDENDRSDAPPQEVELGEPVADEPEPVAESNEPVEEQAESVEAAAEPEDLTPIDVAFDEVDDGEDSFFHDAGEETDVTDGVDVMPAASEPAEPVGSAADEAADHDDDLFDLSTDSPIVPEAQGKPEDAAEVDPFLGPIDGADSGDESSGDLISIDDEDHKPTGPPGAGTTLLTAEHHDEIYEADIPQEDEAPEEEQLAEEELVVDQEPVAEASLENEPDVEAGVEVDPESQLDDVSDPESEPEPEPEPEPDSTPQPDTEAEPDDEVEDEKPALVGLHLDQAPPQQPDLAVDDLPEEDADEPEPEAEPEPDPESEPEPEPNDAVEPVGAAADDFVEGEAETEQADAPDQDIESEVIEATSDEPDLEDDPAPAFDIDAAFDALSEGLDDDDTLDVPAIGSDKEEPEPLADSQLDVGYIKDALAKLEEQDNGQGLPESNGSSSGTASTPDPNASGDDATPTRSPLSQQSPPPGINPTSIHPPQEPGGSHGTGGGGNRSGWFFSLLLFLAIGGVGGWFISQHYDSLIAGRDDDTPSDDRGALVASPGAIPADSTTPTPTPSDTPAPPTIPTPPEPPVDPEPDGSPNPFAAGPSVIGSDALAGVVGGDDDRPLDALPSPAPKPDGPSPIAQPDRPATGGVPTFRPPVVDLPPDAKPVPIEPPVAEAPARIVFLVDASGSLVDSLPQMLVWLNEALQTIKPGEQFAVFYFKSGKAISVEPSGMIKPTRDALLALSENWLNPEGVPVLPSGRSNPGEAIASALKLEPTDLYMLSDESFAFYAGDTTTQQALALVTDAIGERDIRVHGVQFFYRSQDSVLETLADRYDGTFEFVKEKIVPDGDPVDLLKELGGE